MPLSWDFMGKAAFLFFLLLELKLKTSMLSISVLKFLLQITEPEQWDLPAAKKKFIVAKKKLLVYFYGTKEM